MNRFFRAIFNWVFIKVIVKSVKNYLKNVKPFSAEVTLLLSLFSWLVYLIIQDPLAKKFVSIFAWFFLILGADWALLGKSFKVPLLDRKVNYNHWVTAALICLALYSNQFLIQTVRGVVVSWSLIAALVAGFPKFLSYGMRFQLPSEGARQDIIIFTLVCSLISCWFQFHFLLQDIVEKYPSLLSDNFAGSAFVSKIELPNSSTPNQGVNILRNAESAIRNELEERRWMDIQGWIGNLDAEMQQLNDQILDQTFGDPSRSQERDFWSFDAEPILSNGGIDLRLRAIWLGPSSTAPGYGLERSCLLTEASNSPESGLQNPQPGAFYRLECREIQRKRVQQREEA